MAEQPIRRRANNLPMDNLEPIRAPHATSRRAERAGLRYLLCCLAVPLLAYIFPFVAERVPPLNRYSQCSLWGRVLDYAYSLRGEDADVLVFGDSSALTGIDAMRLSRELGMKVINLPGTAGSLPLTGDLPLRRYLAANRPPRLIVFYVAPWGLGVFGSKDRNHHFEGEEQMLRHAPMRNLLHVVLEHKSDMSLFPLRYYATAATPLRFPPVAGALPPPVETRGYMANDVKAPIPADCSLPLWNVAASDADPTRSLMAAYGSAQTVTMAYLAPLPSCQHAEEMAAAGRYAGLPVAPPRILPSRLFADDHSYVHPLSTAVSVTTDQLAAAIQKALAGKGANLPAGHSHAHRYP